MAETAHGILGNLKDGDINNHDMSAEDCIITLYIITRLPLGNIGDTIKASMIQAYQTGSTGDTTKLCEYFLTVLGPGTL